jgi:hypothetical protein
MPAAAAASSGFAAERGSGAPTEGASVLSDAGCGGGITARGAVDEESGGGAGERCTILSPTAPSSGASDRAAFARVDTFCEDDATDASSTGAIDGGL